jgi:hypothetical protein
MPKAVYAQARSMAQSEIVGHGVRRSGLNATDIKTQRPLEVRARRYVWGGRLPAGLVPKLKTEHRSDPYAGMVRMKTATGGSSYLSFRVMMEGSPGWIIPARPGQWIAKHVAESLQRTAAIDIPAAIARDLG